MSGLLKYQADETKGGVYSSHNLEDRLIELTEKKRKEKRTGLSAFCIAGGPL